MYLTRLWYINDTDILKCLEDEKLKRAMTFAAMTRVKRYQDVCFPKEGSSNVFLVMEGRVKLSRLLENGISETYEVIGPGAIFGERPVRSEDLRNESAEAVDDVVCCEIQWSSFQAMLEEAPELFLPLAKQIRLRI